MTWARKRRLARVCRPSCVDVVAELLQDCWIADYSLSLDVGEGSLSCLKVARGKIRRNGRPCFFHPLTSLPNSIIIKTRA
jgi:hypothetical protein